MADQVIYLHGDLDLKIVKARKLPNMDIVTEQFRRCFTACDACAPPPSAPKLDSHAAKDDGGGENHHHVKKIITSDPYVTVVVPQATVARTRVIPNSQNPVWNEVFHIAFAHPLVNRGSGMIVGVVDGR